MQSSNENDHNVQNTNDLDVHPLDVNSSLLMPLVTYDCECNERFEQLLNKTDWNSAHGTDQLEPAKITN